MNILFLKKNIVLYLIMLANIAFCQTKKNEPTYKYLKDGDIIFINKNTEQKKDLNFAGIVFIENKIPYVFFADTIIAKCGVTEFINKSTKKKHSVKRIIDNELLTKENIENMKSNANTKLNSKLEAIVCIDGINIYNAEFIWKIYQSSIGFAICEKTTAKIETPKHTFETKKIVAIKDLLESEQLEYVSE